MTFKARAYGKTAAKVLLGKEYALETYHPDGGAYEFCKKLAAALNRVVDDAMFERGEFAEAPQVAPEGAKDSK